MKCRRKIAQTLELFPRKPPRHIVPVIIRQSLRVTARPDIVAGSPQLENARVDCRSPNRGGDYG
jgi:hypothetical protein